MSAFSDTTTHNWLAQPGPIHLRRTVRRPDRRSDLDAASGIIVGVLGGANVLLWSYIALRAWLG